MPEKIYLSSPHIGTKELNYVQEAFDTNWIAPVGPHLTTFEERLSSYSGRSHVAAVSSGTAAIHLALILLDVKPGDQVICQSMTFSASANPIAYQGAEPVFVDSEPDTWNMDPELLEKACKGLSAKGKKPKAIIPVHLYGMPAKMKEIRDVASAYEIPVIEDAAEALGSRIGDQACGSFGDLSVYSFNGNKIITTSGGGALLSNNSKWIEKARFLATQARDPAPHYEHSEIGYNYRLSNVCAGIGLGQLDVLNQRVAARRSNFERYVALFEKYNKQGFQITLQPEPATYFSNRWLTCIRVDPNQNNGLTVKKLRLGLEEDNIESRPLWKPMHLQPVFNKALTYENGTSENLFAQGLCLPSGSNLSENDWQRIEKKLEYIFSKYI